MFTNCWFYFTQYNRGRRVEERWVFGMVNMDRPTQAMFFYVPRRNAATLHPIIQRHIPAGSTVVSDEWRAYHGLGNIGYLHLTVNHSRNFVNPQTGK